VSLPTVEPGARVRHPGHGTGTVQMLQGPLAIVEFDDGAMHRVDVADLEEQARATQVAGRSTWDPLLPTVLRLQAEAITSANDAWGVFSPSNIDLLPHQLWVCRQVNQSWPTRWLVADDVGLGKTIEAGLILWPLLARGQARRVLILTPASLVEQWRDRMFHMFDIRMQVYRSEDDRGRSNFWEREDQVVASYHTLRQDRNGRHERLFEADPWDLILVDEAHHLNSDEDLGPTLAYRLVQQLEDQGKIGSMVFFTGTPHRGKDWGFLALLQLLRKDLFNPRTAIQFQLEHLPSVIIRNNKYSVTDLQGTRLFQPPRVRRMDYGYSRAEQDFYDLVSEFIENGYAYSNRLSRAGSERLGAAVTLVLIAIQKLAASSVAAVLRALRRRLQGQQERRLDKERLEKRISRLREAQDEEELDQLAELEEQLVEAADELLLMEDEEPHLRELVHAAEAVERETKIELILELLRTDFQDRPVLLFTEYKATQSLLVSRLYQEFGDRCAVFINGDEKAEGVVDARGRTIPLRMTRQQAAEAFNSGSARFLVSTEAGGEGIDLQERCHTLIHVDLPWNPMRLHQRVGRLNRYGQKRLVDVVVVSNPATVEARIFGKLLEKLSNITRAFDEVMDEPEDLFGMVLGFSRNSFFQDLYSTGRRQFALGGDEVSFNRWFDTQTRQFGGQDVVSTVRNLVGHCARFDYQQVSEDVPKVELSDLKPFFQAILSHNRRRPTEEAGSLNFATPDEWRSEPGILPRYSGLHFDRKAGRVTERKKILGVGHRLMNLALQQARALPHTLAPAPAGMSGTLFVFRVKDRLTGGTGLMRFQVLGVLREPDRFRLLKDWEVLLLLNRLAGGPGPRQEDLSPRASGDIVEAAQESAEQFLDERLSELDLPFKYPEAELLGTLWI